MPAAAPTKVPAAAPTPAESEAPATVPSGSMPGVESEPRVKPGVVIGHSWCIIVKAVYPVGIFAVAVFISVIVAVRLVRILISIIPILRIPAVFQRFFPVIVVIGALVAFLHSCSVAVINIITESHLPGGTAPAQKQEARQSCYADYKSVIFHVLTILSFG